MKETQYPRVKTYFGYNIFREENPASTVRKNDTKEGFEFGGQLGVNNILHSNLDYHVSYRYGSQYSNITVGAINKPQDRGYWVRDGYTIFNKMAYQSKTSPFMSQLYFEYKDYSDWAKGGEYDAVILENQESGYRFGLNFYDHILTKVGLAAGFEIGKTQSDYHEYIQQFDYKKSRDDWNYYLDCEYFINQITRTHFKYSYGEFEPYFYWNTDEFQTSEFQLGIERLFLVGTWGIDFNYQIWTPKGAEKDINSIGVSLYFKK